MNKWIGIGRATKDAEVGYTQGSEPMAVARVTFAVDRKFKKDGQQSADFIGCKAFGKTAEFMEKYCRKGTKFVIEGHIQTGSYEKDGQKVYTTDVIIDSLEFAESKNTGKQEEPKPSNGNDFMDIPDDIGEELPFV